MGYACRLYPYKSLLRTARPSQRASQRESGRYAGVNRPCWKGAAVWRPVASTSIDDTRGASCLVRARPLVVGGQLCLVQVGGDSEPRRHAVTRSQPAQVRRFAANHKIAKRASGYSALCPDQRRVRSGSRIRSRGIIAVSNGFRTLFLLNFCHGGQ